MAHSVVFQREMLRIASYTVTTDDADNDVTDAAATTRLHDFYITPARTDAHPLRRWFSDRSVIRGRHGTLSLFETPVKAEITPAAIDDALDIFFIDSHGYIRAIAKSVLLSELAQPLTVEIDAKAVLYLAGGTANALEIRTGDRLLHTAFPDAPVIEQ
ncbi:MAG: DUF192 domain-containing protein [Sphaerospermopsis sp. SIO1G2]|nr:DUF192 domain-containing protein [Sphaerospermopsis sp. SIO1G2]